MKKRVSTSNVFRDLGFGAEEAVNLKVRAMLMVELEKYIQEKHLTQKRAAERLGVTQPRISDLTRGKIELFSVDTLITMLTHAGLKVDVRVRRSVAA
ncbi:MAG: XRE family transcriptional regulator [Nitrospirae bacterium]|jgi:predicted XRE-type DNA-binding protein|nr:MAG: XRE family transcriptional regulator [Nitrospirota bacterium]